jgi:hypothetical protein
MGGDLDEFLKRAAQRRVANAAAKAEDRARQQKPPRPVAPEYTSRQLERQVTSAAPEEDLVVATLVNSSGTTLFPGAIQAAGISSDIDQADERMSSRIHEKFDQEVGNLDASREFAGGTLGGTSNVVVSSTNIVGQLKASLATPSGLRQAVLMREILERPEHRW